MAEFIARIPLPDGKVYHFNVIYNHARCPMSKTPDTIQSTAFTERVVATLQSLGFVNSYYHDRDALPGRNIFYELHRVVDGSDYTIVVLTRGFVADCWKRYLQMTTFKTLLDRGHDHRFLPIAVGLSADEIPRELNIEEVLFFEYAWENDDLSWNILKRVFNENLPVPVVQREDYHIVDAVEESNLPDPSRPDEFDGDASGRRLDDHSLNRGRSQQHGSGTNPAVPQPLGPGTPDPSQREGGREPEVLYSRQPDPPQDVSGSREEEQDIPNSTDTRDSNTGNENAELSEGEIAATSARVGGIYEDLSLDLKGSQATVNTSVNSRTFGREADRNTNANQEAEEGREMAALATVDSQQISAWMDESAQSLTVDGRDIDSFVVSRLERSGISDYRAELGRNSKSLRGQTGNEVITEQTFVKKRNDSDQKKREKLEDPEETFVKEFEDGDRITMNEEKIGKPDEFPPQLPHPSTSSTTSDNSLDRSELSSNLRIPPRSLWSDQSVHDIKTRSPDDPLSPLRVADETSPVPEEDSGIGTGSNSPANTHSSDIDSQTSTPDDTSLQTPRRNLEDRSNTEETCPSLSTSETDKYQCMEGAADQTIQSVSEKKLSGSLNATTATSGGFDGVATTNYVNGSGADLTSTPGFTESVENEAQKVGDHRESAELSSSYASDTPQNPTRNSPEILTQDPTWTRRRWLVGNTLLFIVKVLFKPEDPL